MDILSSVQRRLVAVEHEQAIEILYACESGSRAWGFASPDSDYDIRFIYKRQLLDYLSLKAKPDTLEYPITDMLDFSGWDLRKFLLHLGKSNAVMFEWLQSPIVYLNNGGFQQRISEKMADCFNARSAMHHYLGLARKMLQELDDEPCIKIKKYFYILRSVLAALWIHDRNTIPPMMFDALIIGVPSVSEISSSIKTLHRIKEEALETDTIERQMDIETYINWAIDTCESAPPASDGRSDSLDDLTKLFQNELLHRA